jgi:hypothetical protein
MEKELMEKIIEHINRDIKEAEERLSKSIEGTREEGFCKGTLNALSVLRFDIKMMEHNLYKTK